MSAVTELTLRLQEYQAAELTAGALQDISALRVQGIRRQFDKNRAFYEEMRQLYAVVQAEVTRIKTLGEDTRKPKRARQLYVTITSNKRFYGSLIRDIIEALNTELLQAPDATCLIVGRVGWQYFEQTGVFKRARQLILADDVPTPEEFQYMLKYFESFDRIFVLYPKFINPFKQEVGIEDITQSIEVVQPVKPGEGYLFEPEVPAILAFFDTQVRRVLFDRVLLEAELSRTSARLMRMGEAQQRAQHLVDTAESRMRREIAAVSNMALLETFAGFTQWNKR